MELFKISNFAKSHIGLEFPWFRELTESEAKQIQGSLKRRVPGLPPDPKGWPRLLLDRSTVLPKYNADSKDFNLKAVFLESGIKYDSLMFVNWSEFRNIDAFLANDLALYFDDIWYPSSDDIDLFDASLDWLLTVSHFGVVSVLRLADRSAQP